VKNETVEKRAWREWRECVYSRELIYKKTIDIYREFNQLLTLLGHSVEEASGYYRWLICKNCNHHFHPENANNSKIICDNGEKYRKDLQRKKINAIISRIQREWWRGLSKEDQQTEIALKLLTEEE
jgi:hypothetical protein